MKEKYLKKQKYEQPLIKCFQFETDGQFLAGSELGPVTGGHHSAGDEAPLGDAKEFRWISEEEEGTPGFLSFED